MKGHFVPYILLSSPRIRLWNVRFCLYSRAARNYIFTERRRLHIPNLNCILALLRCRVCLKWLRVFLMSTYAQCLTPQVFFPTVNERPCFQLRLATRCCRRLEFYLWMKWQRPDVRRQPFPSRRVWKYESKTHRTFRITYAKL